VVQSCHLIIEKVPVPLKPIWQEKIIVQPFETDFQGRWKPHCFFQTMQQAATSHATHLGLGYHAMLESEMVWLLARLKLRFLRIPLLGEEVTIQTWPRGLQQKIFFMRDFFFFDEQSEKIAAASSAWLLVHASERRILKPDVTLPAELPDQSGRLALDETLEKIDLPEGMAEKYTLEARYSDTDLMQHVNNARYIEWVTDCFSLSEHRTHDLDWIQINYASEVKPGERVSIRLGENQDRSVFVVQGINLTSGARAFEAAIAWR
jgi:acyl-ACP thioesterase